MELVSEYDDYDAPDEEPYCDRCGGTGWITNCCDDMCQGTEPGEYCMHGSGRLCSACGGGNLL